MKRTIIAFLVAPLIPTIAFTHDAGVTLSFALSYGVSCVFGIPTFLILRWLKKERHIYYGSAGFVLGALYILVCNRFDPQVMILALIFGSLGILGGL